MKANTLLLLTLEAAAFAWPFETTRARAEEKAAPPASASAAIAGAVPNSGIIEGIIKYRADPKRPWRFSRYYIQNDGDGGLAEAVVALEGATLASNAPPSVPKIHTIDQVNFQFVPETLAIRAGDSIRVINSDEAIHNVMTLDGQRPFNVSIAKGKDFTHTFDEAGGMKSPVRLGCIFHGGMRAWVYVFDHPWFEVTQPGGRFRLENVPPGEFKLGIIHPAGKLKRTQSVVVKPNEPKLLEITLTPNDVLGSKEQDN